MKVFLDSSAYAKRFIKEHNTDLVNSLLSEATEVGLSIICLPEVISALCRLMKEKKLSIQVYQKIKTILLREIVDISIYELDPSTVKLSIELLEAAKLRAMDSIHIACAVNWQADQFITADKQQGKAAKLIGLSTIQV